MVLLFLGRTDMLSKLERVAKDWGEIGVQMLIGDFMIET